MDTGQFQRRLSRVIYVRLTPSLLIEPFALYAFSEAGTEAQVERPDDALARDRIGPKSPVATRQCNPFAMARVILLQFS
jgi:hypothetical protein